MNQSMRFRRGTNWGGVYFWLLLFVLALIVLGSSLFSSARGEQLDAVVQVRSTVQGPEGGFHSGSGTVIDAGGHVLTCHHVLEFGIDQGNREAVVTWRSGQAAAMRVVSSDPKFDICLLEPVHPVVCHDFYPVAGENEWPKQGDTVELAGYGGGQFRHWQAPVGGYVQHNTQAHDTISVNTRSISGDSGGAIVFNGKLVGVLWGGSLASQHGPMLATQGTCSETLRPWLELCSGYCFGGGCNSGPCNGGQCIPVPPSFYQRPQQQPQPRQRIVQPRQATPAQTPAATCQCDARFAAIEKRIAALESRRLVAGPKGDKGDSGEDGKSCDTAAILAELKAAQPTAEQVAAALMATYREELRGPPGKDGKNGSDGESAAVDLDAEIANKIRDNLRIEVQHE